MSDFKSQLPSEVFLLGHKIELRLKALKQAKGQFCSDTETITLAPSYDDNVLKRTLLHELFHSLLHFSGQSHYFSSEQEEALCDICESLAPLINFKFESNP